MNLDINFQQNSTKIRRKETNSKSLERDKILFKSKHFFN